MQFVAQAAQSLDLAVMALLWGGNTDVCNLFHDISKS